MPLARKPVSELISIRGDHSIVRGLKARQKRKLGFRQPGRIIERKAATRNRITPRSYSLGMSLANLLFPKNFPEIIATDLKNKKAYSKKVQLSGKSAAGINSFYSGGENALKYKAQERKINHKAEYWKAFFRQKGIVINPKAMNVGISRKNQPIFFEVHAINIPAIEKTISELPERSPGERLRKKSALELFEELKNYDDGGYVLVHIVPP